MNRHQVIIHRWAQKHFDRHREVLDKHKAKGPVFREAVEQLEKTFSDNKSCRNDDSAVDFHR